MGWVSPPCFQLLRELALFLPHPSTFHSVTSLTTIHINNCNPILQLNLPIHINHHGCRWEHCPRPPKSLWEKSDGNSVVFPTSGKYIIVGVPGAFTRLSPPSLISVFNSRLTQFRYM